MLQKAYHAQKLEVRGVSLFGRPCTDLNHWRCSSTNDTRQIGTCSGEASHSSAADCSLSLIQTALMEALHPGAYLEYHAAELGDIVEPLLWRLFRLPVACMQGS